MAISEMIEELVPNSRPSPYVKQWWSLQLMHVRVETRCLGRRSYTRRGDSVDAAHEAYRVARNRYAEAIEESKKDHWKDFLASIDQKTVWMAHRYAS